MITNTRSYKYRQNKIERIMSVLATQLKWFANFQCNPLKINLWLPIYYKSVVIVFMSHYYYISRIKKNITKNKIDYSCVSFFLSGLFLRVLKPNIFVILDLFVDNKYEFTHFKQYILILQNYNFPHLDLYFVALVLYYSINFDLIKQCLQNLYYYI